MIFVLGVQGFVLALVGEYLGRIQREVEGSDALSTTDRRAEVCSEPTRAAALRSGAIARVKRVLVTGGAGFISSNVIRHLLANTEHEVISLDALTYAGNLENLADVMSHERLVVRPRRHPRRRARRASSSTAST